MILWGRLVIELHRALEAGGGLGTLYVIDDLEEIEPGRAVGALAELAQAKAWVAGDGA